jgi:hypothetical protein
LHLPPRHQQCSPALPAVPPPAFDAQSRHPPFVTASIPPQNQSISIQKSPENKHSRLQHQLSIVRPKEGLPALVGTTSRKMVTKQMMNINAAEPLPDTGVFDSPVRQPLFDKDP